MKKLGNLSPGSWKKAVAVRWPVECRWRSKKTVVKTLQGHSGVVTCLRKSRNILVTGSDDGSLIYWSLSSDPSLERKHSEEDLTRTEGFATNNGRPRIELMQQHHKQTRADLVSRRLHGHGGPVWCCAIDRDAVVSGSYDKTVKVWNLSSGKCVRTLRGHTLWVSCVGFSYDSGRIISGSWDSSIRVWNSDVGQQIASFPTLEGNSKYCLDWNKKSGILATGSRNHEVQYWDINTISLIRTFSGHQNVVQSVWNGELCRHLVTGGDDKVLKIWDPSSSTCSMTLEGHTSTVMGVQSDGDYRVVSCSYDKTIKIWDLRMGTSSSSTATAWAQWSGKQSHNESSACIGTLEAHSEAVFCVQFDGNRIYSGSADKSAKIFQFS